MRIRVVVQGRRGGVPGDGAAPLARVLWGVGELAVTCGAVLLLLVAHQLWWTNRQATADAQHQVAQLQERWAGAGPNSAGSGPATDVPGADTPSAADSRADSGTSGTAGSSGTQPHRAQPAPGGGGDQRGGRPGGEQAYAVLRIPKLGVTAPVAEGISKVGVLNKGYTGHYPGTAQPGRPGNFAVAGHRNTHGEPFRYLNRLRSGDTVQVETRSARYRYTVRRTVPQTTPADGTVLNSRPYSSVHPNQRMPGAGHYLTLTTCTPEYTSRYRLIVWGELRAAAPR